VQTDLTNLLSRLDIVTISGWLKTHELLAGLVESLVESPNKAFMRDWYVEVERLETEIVAARNRTLADHVAILNAKDTRTGADAKRGG
jgi:hypothetical protein